MSTVSSGRPSAVRKSALRVPSEARASCSSSSDEKGTAPASSSRSSSGRLVMASYDPAPRAAHSQTWRLRKRGSPRALMRSSSSFRSTPPESGSLACMRLAKFLAHAGVASRRAAEVLVADGRVTVGGETVTDPARDVDESSGVAVDGRAVAPEPLEVHALNKPAGVVSTARDTHGRPTVVELVRSHRRLYPVGRLDADSTGLILLTNDGDLAERLTHPRYGVEKVYRARITPGRLSPRALRALREGVELDDGRTAPARVRQAGSGTVEVVLREGRKR